MKRSKDLGYQSKYSSTVVPVVLKEEESFKIRGRSVVTSYYCCYLPEGTTNFVHVKKAPLPLLHQCT